MSSPLNSTSPSRLAPSGSSPIRPRPSVDLPHPDSPTSPSVSPCSRSKLTPSTARMAPRVVPYQTRRSRTSITGCVAMSTVLVHQRHGVGSSLRSWDRRPGLGRLLVASRLRPARRSTARRHHHGQQPASAQDRVDGLVEAFADERHPGDEQHDREARVERRPPDAGLRVVQRTVAGRTPTRRRRRAGCPGRGSPGRPASGWRRRR